jgi:hypothetical protein
MGVIMRLRDRVWALLCEAQRGRIARLFVVQARLESSYTGVTGRMVDGGE